MSAKRSSAERPAPWPVPRCWEGATVAILGGGPSLTVDQVERCRAAGVRLLAINRAFEIAPDADWLHGCDPEFWTRFPNAYGFAGIKTSVLQRDPTPALLVWEQEAAVQGVRFLLDTGAPDDEGGFDPDPACIRTGLNGGYQTLHTTIHAGAACVLLLGFDMRPGHWHDGYDHCHEPNYETRFVPWFSALKPALMARGVEVLNCTPGSALTCFPPTSLEMALADAQRSRIVAAA